MAVNKTHTTTSTLPPVGGLNVRDAINNMPSGDAISLVNWVPQQYGVRCRKGYREWATGMTDPVKTMLRYQPNREDTATYRLFAATDSNIYNVTTSSNAPPVVKVLSGTNDAGRMSSTMLTNVAGSFLLTAAQAGGYMYYDGTNWVTPTFGGGAGQVNGIDPVNVVFVMTWKKRVWFIEKNSTNAWYGATDAITGAFTKLPLGSLVTEGGKLAFIATWTIDAGTGVDDMIVFAFENGNVLVYKGTDPSTTDFNLVGSWNVGPIPVGRRGFCAFGGDLLILSQLGIQPMSYVTRGGQSLLRASSVDYLGKVQPLFADLAARYIDSYGWDMIVHPKENLLIVNQPDNNTAFYEQYAMYTNGFGWTKFEGIPAISYEVANTELYGGTVDGKVMKLFTGYFDAVPYGSQVGNGIRGQIVPGYSYFGMPGMNKDMLMARATFLSVTSPASQIDCYTDYQELTQILPSLGSNVSTGFWDVSLWDSAVWGGQMNSYAEWVGIGGVGYAATVSILTEAVGDTFLASLDYMFKPGGPM